MRDGIAEAREQLAIVGEDVAIVHGDHAGAIAGEDVAEAGPDIAALAGRAGAKLGGLEFLEHLLHARAFVPEKHRLLRKLREKAARLFPATKIGAVDADDDLVEIGDLLQFTSDAAQGFGADLANMAGQHERDGRFLGELTEFAFEPREIGRPEAVEGGDSTCLVEIGHDRGSGRSARLVLLRVVARPFA